MSLNAGQKMITAEELQRNYETLDMDETQLLKELQFSKRQLENTLHVTAGTNGCDVWKLRDYLVEKLTEQKKPVYPFTILKTNIWFPYRRTW